MKPSLEPWEVGLAERVKQHEFDFEPEAYAQFEQLLAVEAVAATVTTAVTATSSAPWWTATSFKLTILIVGIAVSLGLFFLYPTNPLTAEEAGPIETTSVELTATATTEPTPALLPTPDLTTDKPTTTPTTSVSAEQTRSVLPNPAPARRRPQPQTPVAPERPVRQTTTIVAATSQAPLATEQIKATALLPSPATPYLVITPNFNRPLTTAPVRTTAPFKRDRNTLFPDIKPRR